MKLLAASAASLVSIGGGASLASSGGGVSAPVPPDVRDATCQSSCAGLREAARGGRVELTGRDLGHVTKVRFNKRGGGRVGAKPRNVTGTSVVAVVPDAAKSGRPQVRDAAGNKSRSPKKLSIVSGSRVAQAESAGVSNVSAQPAKGFFAGKRRATASFVAQGSEPQDVRIDVIRESSGAVVRSMVAEDVEPQTPEQVRWNGQTEEGKVAPNGRYDFRVQSMSGDGGGEARFRQYDHIFPVRGSHTYGDGMGAGRNHQGQDIFAPCGRRIVAARGGRVKTKAYHGRAGHYVVIAGKKTKIDYVYMHLKRASKLKVGQRVKTGQLVGRNGESGNASGCHLHFEMWRGGWYDGGSPISPTKHMKRWDNWS